MKVARFFINTCKIHIMLKRKVVVTKLNLILSLSLPLPVYPNTYLRIESTTYNFTPKSAAFKPSSSSSLKSNFTSNHFTLLSQNFLVSSLNKSIRRQTRTTPEQQQQQQQNASSTGKVNFTFAGFSQSSSLKLCANNSSSTTTQLASEQQKQEQKRQQQEQQLQFNTKQEQQADKNFLEPPLQRPFGASLVNFTSSIVRKYSSSSQSQGQNQNQQQQQQLTNNQNYENSFNQADRPKSL